MSFDSTSETKKSKMHRIVRRLLNEAFPGWTYIQEKDIKINGRTLYADFFITGPVVNMIIEVDGKQHDHYSKHFHKNEFNFEDHQHRDKLKEEWAEMNEFIFVRIKENHKMTKKEFSNIIFKAIEEAD